MRAKLLASPLLWPALALIALLAVNVILTPSFLTLRMQDGHLFGSLIDILRNGAPTMLIALGMTLVIASRGIDLSVGAVVAIRGALACAHIAASADPGSPGTVVSAMAIALGVAVALGLWNGVVVSVCGIQPIIATLVLMTAGRGIALLVTDGQIVTVTSAPFKILGAGYVFGLPVAILVSLSVFAVYVFSALCAGVAGLMIASNISAADANNAGLWIEMDAILAVVIGGTS